MPSVCTSLVSLGLLALARGSRNCTRTALLRSRFFPPDSTLSRDRLASKCFSLSIHWRAFQATHLSTPFRSRNIRTSAPLQPGISDSSSRTAPA